ncbi:hypothetical protein BDK92_5709 [Micromonospora pisi]|uniref:Uncharacterized protein n=1 Tax=Micromonospora pisi TaxID=589240 RepID=A0A495JQR9_9ACTN|nr:hypothetical protein BDK92_5709 [Micromonospora pisi]
MSESICSDERDPIEHGPNVGNLEEISNRLDNTVSPGRGGPGPGDPGEVDQPGAAWAVADVGKVVGFHEYNRPLD